MRWSKKIGKKPLIYVILFNESQKCAIFTGGNMILIKDRHPNVPCSTQQLGSGKYDTYKGSTLDALYFRHHHCESHGKYDTYKGSTPCAGTGAPACCGIGGNMILIKDLLILR